MFSQSIRRKIVGIALGLVVLMIATSILSTLMANRVGHLLDELTNKYIPAYGDLARAHVRSLEGALAVRQMVIAKMQTPPDDAAFALRVQIYRTKDAEVTEEAEAARNFSESIIEDPSTPSDNGVLAHIDGRIDAATTVVLLAVTAVLVVGIKESANLNSAIVMVKLGVVAIFLVLGVGLPAASS